MSIRKFLCQHLHRIKVIRGFVAVQCIAGISLPYFCSGAWIVGELSRKRGGIDTVPADRVIPEFPTLQPVSLALSAAEQRAQQKQIALIGESDLRMLIQEGVEQRSSGPPDADYENGSRNSMVRHYFPYLLSLGSTEMNIENGRRPAPYTSRRRHLPTPWCRR